MRALIFLLMIGFVSCGAPDNSPKTRGDNTGDKLLAYNFTTEKVKELLKSPGSAKFPGASEKVSHVQYVSPNKYRISSWVDSQNSFGALVRSHWKCTVI